MMRMPYRPKSRQLAGLLVGLLVTCVALWLLGQCSHREKAPFSSEYSKSGGDTLDIAIEMNPTIYAVRGDSIIGRDYKILKAISEKHGVPMKFHPFVPLKHAIDGLKRGDYDMIVASLPATSEMKESFLMTDPVYLDREILIQLNDSATGTPHITSQMQLAGDTVWVAADSPFAARIANLSQEMGDTIHVMSAPNYSAEYLMMLVARGQIRLAAINESVARAMATDYPAVNSSTPISFTQFQSWALRQSDTILCDSINSWLSAQ